MSELTGFRRVRPWVADEGGAFFPTFSSFEWFVRRHREELLASGEYIIRPGPGGSLCGPGLARVVLEITRRESAARMSKAA